MTFGPLLPASEVVPSFERLTFQKKKVHPGITADRRESIELLLPDQKAEFEEDGGGNKNVRASAVAFYDTPGSHAVGCCRESAEYLRVGRFESAEAFNDSLELLSSVPETKARSGSSNTETFNESLALLSMVPDPKESIGSSSAGAMNSSLDLLSAVPETKDMSGRSNTETFNESLALLNMIPDSKESIRSSSAGAMNSSLDLLSAVPETKERSGRSNTETFNESLALLSMVPDPKESNGSSSAGAMNSSLDLLSVVPDAKERSTNDDSESSFARSFFRGNTLGSSSQLSLWMEDLEKRIDRRKRRESWIDDMLSAPQLNDSSRAIKAPVDDILKEVEEKPIQGTCDDDSNVSVVFLDAEVREQYRIMAIREASERVRRNLGYDPVLKAAARKKGVGDSQRGTKLGITVRRRPKLREGQALPVPQLVKPPPVLSVPFGRHYLQRNA